MVNGSSANAALVMLYAHLIHDRLNIAGRRLRQLSLGFIVLGLGLLVPAGPASAQTLSPVYWQYEALGEIENVLAVDLDQDGFDELIILASKNSPGDSGQTGDPGLAPGQDAIDVVAADGERLWRHELPPDESVIQLVAISQTPGAGQVAIATTHYLRLLDRQGAEMWRAPLPDGQIPRQLVGLRLTPQAEDILLLLESGLVQRYDQHGRLIWEYPAATPEAPDSAGQLIADDLDRDGRPEIVWSYTTSDKVSQIEILGPDGNRQRNISLPARAGAVVAITPLLFFSEAAYDLALGTDVGYVYIFALDGAMRWHRTLNVPITVLVPVHVPDQAPLLGVGTAAGHIVLYDASGQRWQSWVICGSTAPLLAETCSNLPTSSILALASQPADVDRNQPVLLVATYTTPTDASQASAASILITADGQVLSSYPASVHPGLTQLLDSNRDGVSELLQVGFGTVQLLDPGTVVKGIQIAWEYALNASPQAMLTYDIDQDGQDDLIISSSDGRLTRLQANATPDWIQPVGDQIVGLGYVEPADERPPLLVIAYNNFPPPQAGFTSPDKSWGHLMLLQADSSPVWDSPIVLAQDAITSLVVDQTDPDIPLFIVGTQSGHILAYDINQTIIWDNWAVGTITHLTLLPRPILPIPAGLDEEGDQASRAAYRLIASAVATVLTLNHRGEIEQSYTALGSQLDGENSASCVETAHLLQLLEAGASSELLCFQRPLDQWRRLLGGSVNRVFTRDALFRQVGIEHWQRQSLFAPGGQEPDTSSELEEFTSITNTFIGDVTGDGRHDLVMGNAASTANIYQSEGGVTPLNFNSRIFELGALRTVEDNTLNLVVVTENGLVRLFRLSPNVPPYVAQPIFDVASNQYTLGLTIFNPEQSSSEQSNYTVQLEVRPPGQEQWQPQESAPRTPDGTRARLDWVLGPQLSAQGLNYRLIVEDGPHRLVLTPPPGPPALPNDSRSGPIVAGAMLGLFLLSALALATRYHQSVAGQSRYFYQQLQAAPPRTLSLLEAKYHEVAGSADFLLNLASHARADFNRPIASLAQGLFLLADQPDAGVPIINEALRNDVVNLPPTWESLARWKALFGTTQVLLQSPSITSLCLLQPQLMGLIHDFQEREEETPFATLGPVMTYLDSSERVESVEDRIFYLNQALALLRRSHEEMKSHPVDLPHMLARALGQRWIGRISAEVESLRGRANPRVTLKTRRIVPAAESILALELRNEGRAPAEDVIIRLENTTIHPLNGASHTIPFLPPGRVQQVLFNVEQPRQERFRVSFTITYNDRQQKGQAFQFADMVHILAPPQDFHPIPNPYAPGTPLRKTSGLFYGREGLFNFIAEEAGRLAQQRVLILVGQRRTGKTSALLRLDQHLPPHLLPVYIDCQSLGIVPGIEAFFKDLAWLIAEELEARGLQVEAPTTERIVGNPAHWFQTTFIPYVRQQLPPETTLLLVFDEFEALESLVTDHLLPPNLFPYLRHLMQHSEGLGFIFVGTRRLEEMTSNYWHILFNIALYKEIGFLDEAAATRLITEPVAPHIVYDDLAVDKILRMTAGHPYFLQLVCYALVKRANIQCTGYITTTDVNAALDEMLRLGASHFGFLWERSTHAERLLLMALAHLMPKDIPSRPLELVHSLAPYNVHLAPGEVATALNQLVEREILQEVSEGPTSLYSLRIGLVGLWVEQNKSLSKLHSQ